jgi:membrane protease YdiL (CAAX protease family)
MNFLEKYSFIIYQSIISLLIITLGNYFADSLMMKHYVLTLILFYCLYIFPIFPVFFIFKKKFNENFKNQKINIWLLLILLLGWFIIDKLLFLNTLEGAFSVKLNLFLLRSWFFITLYLVIIPIHNEIIFRALTIKSTNNNYLIMLSNFIFSLIAYPNIRIMISMFIYGLIMLYIYKKYQNIFVNIIFTAIYSLLTAVIFVTI